MWDARRRGRRRLRVRVGVRKEKEVGGEEGFRRAGRPSIQIAMFIVR